MGIRSAVFDEWLNQRMTDLQDAVIIHIGCGMDSRVIRIGTDNHKWYDVDLQRLSQREESTIPSLNTIK